MTLPRSFLALGCGWSSRRRYVHLPSYVNERLDHCCLMLISIFNIGTLEIRLITSMVMQGRRRGELVYLLYVLTVSGVALLCHLHSPFSYISGSILHQDDIVEFSLQTHAQSAKVTAVTAKPGCIVIGRQDGSICSYSLGKLAPNSPGMSCTVHRTSKTYCSGCNMFLSSR